MIQLLKLMVSVTVVHTEATVQTEFQGFPHNYSLASESTRNNTTSV